MAETRADLSAYEPDQIYNMDETGLFFRCLPNRAYVTSGRRRRARGTKAMKSKDRVTLVLACNATGTHKVPVSIIGTAQVPLFFKRPRSLCPLTKSPHGWTQTSTKSGLRRFSCQRCGRGRRYRWRWSWTTVGAFEARARTSDNHPVTAERYIYSPAPGCWHYCRSKTPSQAAAAGLGSRGVRAHAVGATCGLPWAAELIRWWPVSSGSVGHWCQPGKPRAGHGGHWGTEACRGRAGWLGWRAWDSG